MVLAVGGHYLENLPACCVRMATPFAGGFAGTRDDMCGALSGGVLVIGALYGRTDPQTPRDRPYALVRTFAARFRSRFGTDVCRPLYGQVRALARRKRASICSKRRR